MMFFYVLRPLLIFFLESRSNAPHPSPIIKMTIQPLGPVNRQASLRGNHIKYFSENIENIDSVDSASLLMTFL